MPRLVAFLFLGKRMWDFSRFTSDCAFGHHKSFSGGANSFETDDIVNSCSQMVLQLHNVYDPEKVKVRIKIVSGSPCGGVVAAEAKRIQSNWVILDKLLKYEKKYCMEELQCNIVVMRRSEPKVLRLNFINSPKMEPEMICPLLSESEACSDHFISKFEGSNMIRVPAVTPASSPEHESLLTRTDVGTSSISSSSDLGTSPLLLSGAHRSLKREYHKHLTESDSDTNSEKLSSSFSSSFFQPWMTDFLSASNELSKHMVEGSERPYDKCLMSAYGSLLENLSKLDREPDVGVLNYRLDLNLSRSVREAISLSTNVPPGPPPLCSICQHKAPAFGNPPRWFNYAELELATGGFSQIVKAFCLMLCLWQDQDLLEWAARQKIAVGAARGLRYLHEECRVGCIVHRDMRPNNILLTHDFEPLDISQLIGAHLMDFRLEILDWQALDDAYIYAMLFVLDVLQTHKLKNAKQARPLLEKLAVEEMIDPRLRKCFSKQEVDKMLQCASLCIRRDPLTRPRMSQVGDTDNGTLLNFLHQITINFFGSLRYTAASVSLTHSL
ncbi:hypothetical protein FEM48_Zijuj08G0008900 [Ziziphus jujuba var. spinosa]|uniref:Protein kinase domain-containing protein n=1 Tax=Ziziphus jujuba var. spinosa TaxID=714518 RepID=A0A978UW20_ZIZJJ|nr:hypothetical protein FEM48_Zijuj08G0008900 [Ziziphus jujuba var. spinosa]